MGRIGEPGVRNSTPKLDSGVHCGQWEWVDNRGVAVPAMECHADIIKSESATSACETENNESLMWMGKKKDEERIRFGILRKFWM